MSKHNKCFELILILNKGDSKNIKDEIVTKCGFTLE